MKCLRNALFGVLRTVKNERNMRIHLCFAFYVISASFVCNISSGQWRSVLLCIALVLSLECINTALERLCNAVHPDKSPEIRAAKDAAAGAVLIAALVSAVVGCKIFFNMERLFVAFAFIIAYPVIFALLLLTLIPAALFVRGHSKGEN